MKLTNFRAEPELIAAVDKWRGQFPKPLTQAEALRRLVTIGLGVMREPVDDGTIPVESKS